MGYTKKLVRRNENGLRSIDSEVPGQRVAAGCRTTRHLGISFIKSGARLPLIFLQNARENWKKSGKLAYIF